MPLIRAGVLANTKRYRGIRRQQTALRSARSARGQPNRSPELRPTNKKGRRLSVREVKELEENRKQLAGLRGYFGSEWSLWLAIQCRKISKSKQFQTFIISAIFAAGFLVGWQTYEEDTESTTSEYISYGDSIILVIFIFEILVKMLAEGNKPHKYFKDGWNCFDFVIVAVGALPFGGNAVTALRLVRLLRVLKLVRALPKLRILVMGLINSLSSIAYISLLLLLLFYLYAVVGVSLFEKNDPVHFGTLHIATLTLFRCSTLEDWTDVMYIQMYGCDDYGYDGMMEECTDPRTLYSVSILYFVTFVVLSAMMILNLFIGVITSSMQDAKLDIDEEDEDIEEPQNEADEKLDERLTNLSSLLADLNNEIDEFATLERERSGHTKVLISGKNPEKNMMTDQHGNDIAHTLMSDDKIRKNSLTSQTSLGSPLHSHSRMRTGSGSGSFDRPSFRRSSSGNIPSMFSSIPLGGGGGIHSVAFSSSPKRDMSERRGSNLPVVEEAETGGSPDSDRALLNNNNINNNNNSNKNGNNSSSSKNAFSFKPLDLNGIRNSTSSARNNDGSISDISELLSERSMNRLKQDVMLPSMIQSQAIPKAQPTRFEAIDRRLIEANNGSIFVESITTDALQTLEDAKVTYKGHTHSINTIVNGEDSSSDSGREGFQLPNSTVPVGKSSARRNSIKSGNSQINGNNQGFMTTASGTAPSRSVSGGINDALEDSQVGLSGDEDNDDDDDYDDDSSAVEGMNSEVRKGGGSGVN